MSGAELKAAPAARVDDAGIEKESPPRLLPFLITLGTVMAAAWLGWQGWQVYMGAPWTRDGAVRVYVVTIAPEVAGRIVELPVIDNQLVRKGDLLLLVDPADYRIAVRQAEAAVQQTQAVAENAQAESDRRQQLNLLAVTVEEKQTFASRAASAQASYRQALANLDAAQVNLERTRVVSPVNGYVTNLLAQLGDYATVGQQKISVINADSFWVDGYFEETTLGAIREGDAASVKLMGYSQILRGHVEGIARGINVPNAQPNASGLASVNPIFTFVRLAQRVPVRIRLDGVPDGVRLVAGMTATVQIDARQAPAPAGLPAAKPVPEAAASAGEPPKPLRQGGDQACGGDQEKTCPPSEAAPQLPRRRPRGER
jgi:multidrug resistance efflux pump